MNPPPTLLLQREAVDAASGAVATVAQCELMCGVDEADILHIETQPSHRRRGLARSLLKEVFAWCADHDRSAVWLEVRASNAAAIALYEQMGFVHVSTRSCYYSDGEDALVMKYSL